MIIKEYDLDEEKRNYPYSVHRCKVEKLVGRRTCTVEYNGKFWSMTYPDKYFKNLDPESLIEMTARYIANKQCFDNRM